METLLNGVDWVLVYINSIPTSSWVALGVLLGSVTTAIGITAAVKRYHLRKHAEKLASTFVILNVTFWSALAGAANWVILNAETYSPFLPFWFEQSAKIMSGAIVIRTVSLGALAIIVGVKKWWQARRASNVPGTLQRDAELIQTVSAPAPVASPIQTISVPTVPVTQSTLPQAPRSDLWGN